ncbi:ubiquitin elongating factor core-domain-containing protein [Aspergillus cavernicola]|uniref:peptidylprolyl isomerase n=1 Tax=Aspergillus cavernicola TaxID=176166 RepID=A0ABR4J0R1_9EURO
MGDQLSEADKIRSKRLAKLANPAPSAQSGSGEQSAASTPQTEPSQPEPQPQPQPSKISTPPSTSRPEQEGSEGKRIKITPSTSTPASNTPPIPKAEDTLEAFEDRTLSAVFKLTLAEHRQKDIHGQRLTFLPGVRSELQDQNRSLRIDTSVLDQALLEAASNQPEGKPLDYLLPCWKRILRLHKGFRRARDDDPKFQVICEARRLCMSYCVFAITMPEMFGLDPSGRSPIKPYLLLDPEDDKGVDSEFIIDAVKRFEEDESVKPAFIAAVEEMSRELSSMTIGADYKPYVTALRNLVRHVAIAAAITESSFFNASREPASFEKETLLGPWFRLSPLEGNATLSFFSSPKTQDQGSILSAQRSVRMVQELLSSDILDIVNHMIRASPDARNRILDWFAAALNINHKRRAMQVDPNTVSSDGFMFNLTTCLDQLCQPFMDASFSKIDRIDIGYLHRNPRVNIKDETKINADQHASDAFYAKKSEGTSNFITEIFFLTVAAHHYGSESLTSKLEILEKDLKHMESTIVKLEADRHKWVNNPIQLRMFETHLKKYKDKLDLGLALKYSLQGVLFDDQWQFRSMTFMRYVVVWLLRMASGKNFPKEQISLPLPEQPSEVFQCLPEYFVDDIVSNFKFIMWCMPQIITATQGDELVMLCIAFLESSEYIKNPYLKAGLVSILYRGTWPRPGGATGVLVDLLNSMPFANEYLLHSLMKFYIEAEHTGAHNQFYDKFNIRYEIFQIIKCIWPNTLYRTKLHNQAKRNLDFFVQYVNLLLNDVTYVLDESFGSFKTIYNTQLELRTEGPSMDPTLRQENEERLSQAQRNAKSYMQLTNETVSMLKLFTDALAESFTMPEIVQRLADMLDYNLDAMVGTRSSNLRVENLHEYGFRPRALLSEIVDVYLNLAGKQNFITAVARDGRSYKPANFEKAAEIMRKWSLKSTEELKRWDQLQLKVKQAKEADEQEEEDLGEVPDDFLDPLMYTLMEDPVILPASKMSIDRATIRSHLLSDPHDPFNRVPLKIEDVLPDTELKAKIEEFKRQRLAERRGGRKEEQATIVQWLTSWHPAGKTSCKTSRLNIPGYLAWSAMEIVGPLNLLYILSNLPAKLNIQTLPLPNKLVASLYLIHYTNRAIISPFFAAPSMSPIHAFVMASAMLFNWLNSSCLACWLVGYNVSTIPGFYPSILSSPSLDSLATPPEKILEDTSISKTSTPLLAAIGLALFTLGMVGNIYAERTLFSLRREAADKQQQQSQKQSITTDPSAPSNGNPKNENKYHKVYVIPPPHGLFKSILYPHYALEWLEWTGFALVGLAVFPTLPPPSLSPSSLLPDLLSVNTHPSSLMGGTAAVSNQQLHLAPWLVPAVYLAGRLRFPVLPLPAIIFVVNAVANMLPHARWGRKWYAERFGREEVAGRGAVVPFVSWL